MSSKEFTIEVFIDVYGRKYYGCPEYDLWGYQDVQTLEGEIFFERNKMDGGWVTEK